MGVRHLYTSYPGVRHYIEDEEHGKFKIHSFQDSEAILDENKAMATHNDGYSPSRDLRRAARIPPIIALKWLNEEGWWMWDPNCADKLKAKLNDPDYLWLRTATGRL